MFKNNKKGGFTLIELLIVIAIIGVLAATVVVSLGSQTDKAQQGSVKIGVSSIRNLATVVVVEGKDSEGTALSSSNKVCKAIYSQVSGEKGDWTWKSATECATVDGATGVNESGEICCASTHSGNTSTWVLWGAGKSGEYYCADSTGFAGDVTQSGSRDTTTTVEKANNSTKPISCE